MERDYAVPFRDVWRAALAEAGTVQGWTILGGEPARGLVRIQSRTRFPGTVSAVEVRLSLDHDGLTRVVVTAELQSGAFDFGVNRSRSSRFLQRLDRVLVGVRRR